MIMVMLDRAMAMAISYYLGSFLNADWPVGTIIRLVLNYLLTRLAWCRPWNDATDIGCCCMYLYHT